MGHINCTWEQKAQSRGRGGESSGPEAGLPDWRVSLEELGKETGGAEGVPLIMQEPEVAGISVWL